MDTEIWKESKEFIEYEVSNLGRVRSNKNKTPRILKQKKHRGYPRVCISKSGKNINKRVNRFVLETFVGNCPKYFECSHLDGNKNNNCLENLKWETHTDNMRRRKDIKLNYLKASWIRLLLKRGWDTKTLSNKFDVSIKTIYGINENYKWRGRINDDERETIERKT